jgi:hypothetical protein
LRSSNPRATEFTRHKPDVVIPESVLERIADIEDASPRELIGVFTKLATYADLTKKPITLEVAEEAVGLRAGPAPRPRSRISRKRPAEFYKLDVKDFHSPQRAPPGRPPAPGGDVSVAQADHPLLARNRTAFRGAATTPPCCMPAAASRP